MAALARPTASASSIGALAQALRDGDADAVLDLLRAGADEVSSSTPATRPRWPASATTWCGTRWPTCGRGRWPATPTAALEALRRHRLLCAHREGPYGVGHWNRSVERWLADATGRHRRRLRRSGTPAARCW